MAEQIIFPFGLSMYFIFQACSFFLAAASGSEIQNQEIKTKFVHIGSRAVVGGRKSDRDFQATNYYASQDAVTWTTALQVCDAIFGGNASLLSIETEEENNWITGYLSSRGIIAGVYWTSGLYDIAVGIWRWRGSPGAEFDNFTSWGAGEPASINGRQRVVVNFLVNRSHWESSDDTVLNRMICEIPPEEIPPVEGEPTICWEKLALVIAVDSSSFVGSEPYAMIQEFSSNLSSAFSHVVGKKFGFINYSLLPNSVIHLRQSLYSEVISAEILSTPYQNHSRRNTQDAMWHGMLQLEAYSEDVPKTIIVVTTGISESPAKTKQIADLANAAGIRTFAIGVSYSNPGNELRNIAGGIEDRIFQAEWDRLEDLLLPLSEALCAVEV